MSRIEFLFGDPRSIKVFTFRVKNRNYNVTNSFRGDIFYFVCVYFIPFTIKGSGCKPYRSGVSEGLPVFY